MARSGKRTTMVETKGKDNHSPAFVLKFIAATFLYSTVDSIKLISLSNSIVIGQVFPSVGMK